MLLICKFWYFVCFGLEEDCHTRISLPHPSLPLCPFLDDNFIIIWFECRFICFFVLFFPCLVRILLSARSFNTTQFQYFGLKDKIVPMIAFYAQFCLWSDPKNFCWCLIIEVIKSKIRKKKKKIHIRILTIWQQTHLVLTFPLFTY